MTYKEFITKYFYKAKNSIIISLLNANILSNVAVFLSTILIARALSIEGFGKYSMIHYQAALFSTIALYGLDQKIIKVISSQLFTPLKLLRLVLLLRFMLLFIAGLLILIYLHIARDFTISSWILTFLFLFQLILVNTLESIIIGLTDTHKILIGRAIFRVTWIIVVAALFFLSDIYWHYIMALIISQIFYALFLFSKLNKKNIDTNETSPVSFNLRESLFLLREGTPYFLTSFFGSSIANYLGILILNSYWSKSEVGYFGVVERIGAPISLFVSSVLTALLPILIVQCQKSFSTFEATSIKVLRSMLAILVPFSFIISIFSHFLIMSVFGDRFQHSSYLLQFYAWFFVLSGIFSWFGVQMISIGKENRLAILTILNSLIYLMFFLLFVPLNGTKGLVVAYLLGGMLVLTINVFGSIKLYDYRLIVRGTFPIIGVSMILFTPLFFLQSDWRPVGAIVSTCLLIFSYSRMGIQNDLLHLFRIQTRSLNE